MLFMQLSQYLKTTHKTICIKSTVPVGTNQDIKNYLADKNLSFDLVFNPEFLREGSAIKDFLENNPIVLGGDSSNGIEVMESVYAPFIAAGANTIKTNFSTAELMKYAWNSFSTIKVAYINELSDLCGN